MGYSSSGHIADLISEILRFEKPADLVPCMRALLLIYSGNDPEPDLPAAELKAKLLKCAYRWSTCEFDPDYHLACNSVRLLGKLKPGDSGSIETLFNLLTNIKAPRCVQNHAARALGSIGTREARQRLEQAKEVVTVWAQKPAYGVYWQLVNIIDEELSGD